MTSTYCSKFAPSSNLRRRFLQRILPSGLGLVLTTASSWAQTTISYTDGQNNTAGISVSAPNDPTTLSIITGSATQSGVIGGIGSAIKAGAGALALTGNNIYTGGTTISAGILQVGNGGTSGSIAGDVVNNGSLLFNRSDATSFAGAVSGTGGLTQAGTGTVTLTGANSYSGGTTVNAGTTLQVGSVAISSTVSALGNQANDLTLNGTLDLNGNNQGVNALAGSGTVLNNADGTNAVLTVQTGNLAGRYYGYIIDNGGHGATGTVGLDKTGSGTLVLMNGSSYTGGTTIDDGILQLWDPSNGLSDTGAVTINGGMLQLGSNETIGTLSGSSAGLINLRSTNDQFVGCTLSVNQAVDGTFAGNIGTFATIEDDEGSYLSQVPGGSLVKAGAATLTLSGFNGYSGPTTIQAGSLVISGYLGYNFSNPNSSTFYNGAISNSGSLTFANTDASYLRQYLGGVISGPGTLTQAGNSTLILTGENTYTGLTTITSGTLQVGNGSSGSVVGDIANNSNLVFDRDQDVTYAGTISGTGTMANEGAGKLTLTGDNTYTGGTTNFSPLQLGDGGHTGSIKGDVANYGGLIFNHSNDVTFTGAISGSGGVTQAGTGVLALTGANGYTGSTTINSGGTVKVSSVPVSADVSSLGSQSNGAEVEGTLDLNGHDQGVGALTGGGKVLNSVNATTQTLTVGNGDASSSFSGTIADNNGGGATGQVGLTKTGAGTLTLTSSNTYTGATTIQGGTLVLGSSNPLSGASLVLDATQGVTTSGGIVTGWADQSGHGNHATAGAGGVTVGSLNGKPALLFDGNSYLATSLSGTNPAYTIFSVFQADGTSGNQTILGSAVNGAIQFRLNDDKIDVLMQGVSDLANSTGSVAAGNPTLGGATVQDGSQVLYLGTETSGTGSSGFGPGGDSSTLIGSNGDQNEKFTGEISSLLVFDSVLSAAQITAVQNYLNHEFLGGALIPSDLGGSLSTLTAVNITASGAALDLNGNIQTVGSLAGVEGSSVYLGHGALTVGADNTSTTFAGTLSDSGGLDLLSGGTLTKIGTGTLALTGSNTYTGGTTVVNGTLAAGNDNALGSGKVVITGGTLLVKKGTSIANEVDLAGGTLSRELAGNSSLAHTVDATSGADGTGTKAAILAGTLNGEESGTTILSARFSSTPTFSASNDSARLGDVFHLTGTGSSVFVLQLTVTGVSADSFLGWLNGGTWVNAIDGDTGNVALAEMQSFNGSFAQYELIYGSDPLSQSLGAWGRDIGDGTVWAVINHNSDYAVVTDVGTVPEPTTWAMIIFGLIGLAFAAKRRSEAEV